MWLSVSGQEKLRTRRRRRSGQQGGTSETPSNTHFCGVFPAKLLVGGGPETVSERVQWDAANRCVAVCAGVNW